MFESAEMKCPPSIERENEKNSHKEKIIERNKNKLLAEALQLVYGSRVFANILYKMEYDEFEADDLRQCLAKKLLDFNDKQLQDFIYKSSFRQIIVRRMFIDFIRSKKRSCPEMHVDKEELYRPQNEDIENRFIANDYLNACLQDLEEDIEDIIDAEERAPTRSAEEIVHIIWRKIAGQNNVQIADEMGLTKSRLTQICKGLKKKFPEYYDIFSIPEQVYPKNVHEIAKEEKRRIERAEKETFRRVRAECRVVLCYDDLFDEERNNYLAAVCYLDYHLGEIDEGVLKINLQKIGRGVDTNSKKKITYFIEELAGRKLFWSYSRSA